MEILTKENLVGAKSVPTAIYTIPRIAGLESPEFPQREAQK